MFCYCRAPKVSILSIRLSRLGTKRGWIVIATFPIEVLTAENLLKASAFSEAVDIITQYHVVEDGRVDRLLEK